MKNKILQGDSLAVLKTLDKESINMLKIFNHISPSDLEDIMEYFEDMNYLSEKGKVMRKSFWELFIKTHE